jgi:hypothetical protein
MKSSKKFASSVLEASTTDNRLIMLCMAEVDERVRGIRVEDDLS